MKARRFGIGKACLLHGQNGAAGTVIKDRKPDNAFKAARTGFAVMPGPADLHSFAIGYRQNVTGHTMLASFRLDHHR